MKKSLFIKLMLIVSIAFSGIASADSNKKVRWRLAETWGPNFPIFGDATKNMAKMVKEMSNGRLTIKSDASNKHKSALGIFDWIPDIGEHVGCYPLAKKIEELPQLKAHISGHIHESYGFAIRESDGLKFANASTCDARYRPVNPPIIIDL